MSGLVYYSSASENTRRFVEKMGLPATRIPIRASEPLPQINVPYVLICPTYADGHGNGAVPKGVIRWLNDLQRRGLLRGVIASGNRNFGETFAMAGRVIAQKCNVPVLYRFELAGTQTDITRARAGLSKFWGTECLTPA